MRPEYGQSGNGAQNPCGPGAPEEIQGEKRASQGRSHRTHRDVLRKRHEHDEYRKFEKRPNGAEGHEKAPNCDCNSLSSLELQPWAKDMPPCATEEGGGHRDAAPRLVEAQRLGNPQPDETREQPLAEIEHEDGVAAHLALGPDGIGRADIARALVAEVLVVEDFRDDKAPRYRTQQEGYDKNPQNGKNSLHR